MKMRVAFLWHNVSAFNLGVAALSISNIRIIKDICDAKKCTLDVLTVGDHEVSTEENHTLVEDQLGLQINHVVFSLRRYLKQPSYRRTINDLFVSADLIIDNGAGDSFSDIYGVKRLLLQCASKIIILSLKKRLVLAPQTIGPFNSTVGRMVSQFILKRAVKVFARDNISFENASNNCIASLTTDVAFSLPYHAANKPKNAIKQIAINVSGLLWNGGYTKDNQFKLAHSYKLYCEALIERINTRNDCEVVLLGHVNTKEHLDVENDYAACIELQRAFPNLLVAPKFTNAIDVKSYISGVDILIGARMHATIAALSSGVSVIPYSYSRKFEGLFGTLGYTRIIKARELCLDEAVNLTFMYIDEIIAGETMTQNALKAARILQNTYTSELGAIVDEIINEKIDSD